MDWRGLVEDKESMEVMRPPALGEMWDGGGACWREPVDDKKCMEVMKPPALGERWDGGGE